MKCKFSFSYFEKMDMFSKRINLYYNGKNKQYSMIGIIFTFIYISIFIFFFIYKFVKMMKKNEIIVYDTYAYSAKPPFIKLSYENFYGGFALEDPFTYDPFIDERIYYPKAYFKKGFRNGTNWMWNVKELEIEQCKIEKFGKNYKDIFKVKPLHNLYCFKEMNETLIGHYIYDNYSLFFISFFPCKNTTENNNHCKPRKDIDFYLDRTFINFNMEDIEIDPQNIYSPTLPRDSDIYTIIGKKIFKEIHVFYQIINIETDLDIFGIENFQRIKKNKFLKYDSMSVMSSLIERDIYATGESFCDVTIKLSDKVLTQKRTYAKFVETLGNIGGFMGVIYSFLKFLSSFSTHILYEISLVNNLFEFDVDKKIIYINSNGRIHSYIKPKIYLPIKRFLSLTKNIKTNKEEKINNIQDKYKNKRKNEIFVNKSSKTNTYEIKFKPKYSSNFKDCKYNSKLFKSELNNKKNYIKNNDKSEEYIFNFDKNYNEEKNKNKENIIKKVELIKNLKFSNLSIYFCFFCVRKRNNVHNILLDEGLRIIAKQLDLVNIFKKLYKEDENKEILGKNDLVIKMSKDCKNKLEQVYNKKFIN